MENATTEFAALFKFVGRLWQQEVDLETVGGMNEAEFRQAFEALGGMVPASTSEVIEQLAVEYCEVFVGPQKAISPVQSIWESNQFQSESSASMNRFLDLIPGFTAGGGIVDHLGVQLAFVGVILDLDEVQGRDILRLFFQKHLSWQSQLLTAVESQQHSKFYSSLAVVTSKLISQLEIWIQEK